MSTPAANVAPTLPQWADEAAFRDGNLVWGRVVADIPAFNCELVADLAEG